jgi:branched-chain amino acid transport system permease protein
VRPLPAVLVLGVAALALVYPRLVGTYWLYVGTIALIYSMLASSWSLLAGYAGQFSFAHMAFASLGAYTSGLLVRWYHVPIPLGMLSGAAICCLLGGLFGWPCLRLRGPYLAIFTLAFSEILRIVFVTEDEVTMGVRGLHVAPLFAGAVTQVTLPRYYYTGLALLAVCLAVMGTMVQSRWGLFFRAIREDEQAAAASGVNVVRFKILAFAAASMFAGLAGAFFGHLIGMLTPDIGGVDQMGLVVAMAIVGGLESLPAAVGGAIGLEVLQEVLRDYGDWRFVLFGALVLFTMRFARNGLLAPALGRLAQVGAAPRPAPAGQPVGQEGNRA